MCDADLTSWGDVNAALLTLRQQIQTLLGQHFLGMYLVGSLALEAFDPARSDIDFIVVTDTTLADALVDQLAHLHAQFAAGPSAWAKRIEAVYVPQAVLSERSPAGTYPQLEQGEPLINMALEEGWVFQRWTLRERSITVAGPHPQPLVAPTTIPEMRAAVAVIAGGWWEAAHQDPTWVAWLHHRPHHRFVLQTLCRMLYSLATGTVTSKLQAITWAQQGLGGSWRPLIERALSPTLQGEPLTQREVDETLAFIQFTVKQSQRES